MNLRFAVPSFAATALVSAAGAAVIPFTEDFAADAANWRDAPGTGVLTWNAAGGPDGGAFASTTFNFVNSAPNATPALFRAHDEFNSSDHAFEGNWISEGVTEFSAFVRHSAPQPLTFFTRFSHPGNFPGAVGITFAPVLPFTWTRISFAIVEGNPQFINFETTDFNTVFANIGHVQIGVSVPTGLAGVDQTYTFSVDKPTIVPEPAAALPLLIGLALLLGRGCARARTGGSTRPIGGPRGASAARHAPLAALVVATAGAAPQPAARAQSFNFGTPSDDRWHYPFNFTPGTRATGSCFGTNGLNGFNDRDGVVLVAWNTGVQIPPGQGAANYRIHALRVTLTNEPNAVWPIDLTTDEWFTFDANGDMLINADGVPRGQPGDTDGESSDDDPGRPTELFGVGFGPHLSEAGWNEFSTYFGSAAGPNLPRDPFPFVYQDGTGTPLHAEDSIKGLHNAAAGVAQFTPQPWAIGVPQNYAPGAQATPFDVVFDVDLNAADGRVRAYFQDQLDRGRVIVAVTSLRESVMFQGSTNFPSFYLKEGVASGPPGAKAAALTIVLAPAFERGDANCDGGIDFFDIDPFLLALFDPAAYGLLYAACTLDTADVNADGSVDFFDIDPFLTVLFE